MNGEDDAAWLEALAGRGDATDPAVAARARPDVIEAAALRELIRAQPADPEIPEVPAVDPKREEQLIFRARAAGLLPGPAAVPVRRWWARRGALAAAAGIVIAAVGLTWLRTPSPPPETLRGGGAVHLQARDPAALKRQLTEELRAAGARVTGYERLGRPGIDVDLPQPLTPQIRRVLEAHDLPIPEDGELTVEFEPPRQP